VACLCVLRALVKGAEAERDTWEMVIFLVGALLSAAGVVTAPPLHTPRGRGAGPSCLHVWGDGPSIVPAHPRDRREEAATSQAPTPPASEPVSFRRPTR
jgi:hypothetical protein